LLAVPKLLLVVVASLALAAGIQAGSAHKSRDAKLRSLLAAAVSRANAPGGVLLVKTPKSTWVRGFGAAKLARSYEHPKPGRRMPMPARGRFRVASISKTFTAVLVLKLVGDGTLSLDDTVDRWLPGRLPNGAGAHITILHLLEHRSGLHDGLPAYPGQIIVAGPPGKFYYANSNYALLGEVVEAAGHSSYAEQVEARILHPLALARTVVAPAPVVPAGLVHGYAPERVNGLRVDVTAAPTDTVAPAGGLVSNALDLARFERALFTGHVLPPDVVASMRTPLPLDGFDGHGYTAYGIGLQRFPTRWGAVWGHRGHGIGYTAWMLSTPGGARTVVLLLNTGVLSWPLTVKVNPLVERALCL
jgi:D-alanyl-D-alanine carboxypeptidase